MCEDPRGSGPRPDLQPRLRAAALTAVIAGVLLLAAAAFVLSYAGVHRIALAAEVSPGLARLYPLIFDAMLVIAGSSVLATRTAGWGTRAYVWGCLLLLLAGVATGDAVHAMNIALPRQQSRAAVAVTPWVLLLLAFGLLLAMLRHLRKARPASGHNRHSTQAGHVRPTAASTAVPGMRALPAGEADVAAPAASGVPAPGVPAGGVAAGGGAAAHGGTAAVRPSAATAGNPGARPPAPEASGATAGGVPSGGAPASAVVPTGSGTAAGRPTAPAGTARARPPAAAARDVAGRVAPGSHEAPGGTQPDSATAAVEPHAGKRPPVGGRPAGAGLGFP